MALIGKAAAYLMFLATASSPAAAAGACVPGRQAVRLLGSDVSDVSDVSGDCVDCPAGKFDHDSEADTVCKDCRPGFTSRPGSIICVQSEAWGAHEAAPLAGAEAAADVVQLTGLPTSRRQIRKQAEPIQLITAAEAAPVQVLQNLVGTGGGLAAGKALGELGCGAILVAAAGGGAFVVVVIGASVGQLFAPAPLIVNGLATYGGAGAALGLTALLGHLRLRDSAIIEWHTIGLWSARVLLGSGVAGTGFILLVVAVGLLRLLLLPLLQTLLSPGSAVAVLASSSVAAAEAAALDRGEDDIGRRLQSVDKLLGGQAGRPAVAVVAAAAVQRSGQSSADEEWLAEKVGEIDRLFHVHDQFLGSADPNSQHVICEVSSCWWQFCCLPRAPLSFMR